MQRAAASAAGLDRAAPRSGKACAYLRASGRGAAPALVQTIAATDLLGKRLRLSAWLKAGEDARASLFFRIDGARRTLAFAADRSNTADHGWQERSVILDVPDNATLLTFGVIVSAGQVFMDDVQLERVGHEFTPSRSRPAGAFPRPVARNAARELRNGGFEDE